MTRALLLLPVLSLHGGCHALNRDVEVIDYRPGSTVATTVARADAEYRLSAPHLKRSWLQSDVPQGAAVGFRREPDGKVVAFAGEQSWRIDDSDGRHVWLSTPKPATAWDRSLVGARKATERACISAAMVLTAPFWLPHCAVTDAWP